MSSDLRSRLKRHRLQLFDAEVALKKKPETSMDVQEMRVRGNAEQKASRERSRAIIEENRNGVAKVFKEEQRVREAVASTVAAPVLRAEVINQAPPTLWSVLKDGSDEGITNLRLTADGILRWERQGRHYGTPLSNVKIIEFPGPLQ